LLNPDQPPAHGPQILQAPIWMVCRASYGLGWFGERLIGAGVFDVKWNRSAIGHVSRAVDVLGASAVRTNVRYPTEAARWEPVYSAG
jgi:hypothetical protein